MEPFSSPPRRVDPLDRERSHAGKGQVKTGPLHGCGLRFPHVQEWLALDTAPCLLEVHTENLFALSPSVHQRLEQLRARHGFSMHGVGMSLGSCDGLDPEHLRKVVEQVRRYQPDLISEHLAWNRIDGICVPDLLPMPFDQEALQAVCDNIERVQEALARPIAVENISSYLIPPLGEGDEADFSREVTRRTGCTLLVDLNNMHVNQLNHGLDAWSILERLPHDAISQWHLGGPTEVGGAWIDTHANTVPEEVWALYERALERVGPRPTIIEWDQDLPPLQTLLELAERARRAMDQHSEPLQRNAA